MSTSCDVVAFTTERSTVTVLSRFLWRAFPSSSAMRRRFSASFADVSSAFTRSFVASASCFFALFRARSASCKRLSSAEYLCVDDSDISRAARRVPVARLTRRSWSSCSRLSSSRSSKAFISASSAAATAASKPGPSARSFSAVVFDSFKRASASASVPASFFSLRSEVADSRVLSASCTA